MRIGYLHCFSGISGDMFLGALMDAGVPLEFLRKTAQSLNLGPDLRVDLRSERVDRSGLSAIKVHVLEAAVPAAHNDQGQQEEVHSHSHAHSHSHSHSDDHGHIHEHTHEHSPTEDHGHSHPHTHEHPYAHDDAGREPSSSPSEPAGHSHAEVHGRSLSAIRTLIEQAGLEPQVERTAIRAFELLGASEAKMHNVPIEQVHFHEVGAVDAIIDIVCGCAGAFWLGVDQWVCSPLNVGSGMVRCAHGVFPVPAPATLDLLEGVPIYSAGPEGERVTPTGAALIRALACSFGPMPLMRTSRTGYGAGSRNPENYPNVVRMTLGESQPPQRDSMAGPVSLTQPDGIANGATIAVLETAIDDSTPQVIGFLMETALAAGAHDVMTTPVHMKKNRMGTLITILCEPQDTTRFCELLFRETSTIGIRTRLDRRQCLEREMVTVQTEWGQVRLKIARLDGVVMNAAPEFEDCRRLAQLHDVPLRNVQREAEREYAKMGGDGALEHWKPGVSGRS